MKESKRLIRNTGIIALGGMATKLVTFLLLPLYTSVLSTGEFGTVDYMNTIALFLVPAVTLLMDEALFRFLIDCKTEAEQKEVITTTTAILAAGLILFSFTMILIWTFLKPQGLPWVTGLVVAQGMLTMTSAILRGFGETFFYALLNFLASGMTIVLNVTFIAILHWGVDGMMAATIIAQGGMALLFVFRMRFWRYFDRRTLSAQEAKNLIKYSVPLIPNKVSWTIMNMLDRLIIMNVIGAEAAGIYAVSYKFPSVMDQLYGFFYQSWKESSARALNSDENESLFYNSVYKALRRFMISVTLVMTALMPIVYGVLIKGQFIEGILYVPILLLATYFSNISGFYGGVFTAYKDTKIMGITTVASAMLCVVLCLILIPPLGLYGASAATLASTFAVNEYRRQKVKQYVHLTEDLAEVAVTLAAVIIIFASYYVYAYTNALPAMAICVALSLVFAICANAELIKRARQFIHSRRR